MTNQTRFEANWFYWEAGILTAVAAAATTPVDETLYFPIALITLLFTWGFIRS